MLYEFTIKKRVNDSQIHPSKVDLVQLNEAHSRGSGHKNDRPLVYPHATMLDLNTVEAYTGLFFYDLDKNFAPLELIQQPYVFRAYKSASGTGSHVWIKAPKELDSTNFKDLYLAVGDALQREFGIKYDPACAQPTRMAFIPKNTLQVDNPDCERYQYQWVEPAEMDEYSARLYAAKEGERNTTIYKVTKDAYKNGDNIDELLEEYINTFPEKERKKEWKTVEGAKEKARKEIGEVSDKELEQFVRAHKVDLSTEHPEPLARLAASDTTLIAKGGFLLIKAPPKSGKSRLIGYMIDALTGKDAGALSSVILPKKVAYFDTEQAIFSIASRVTHAENLDVFTMADLSAKKRFGILLKYLQNYAPCVAVVDNIRDMAPDGVNNEKESSKMFEAIHKAQGDSSLILVQHTNKEGLNASGHLGSFAEQKAHTTIAVRYDKPTKEFSFEGSGRFGSVEKHVFTWDTPPYLETGGDNIFRVPLDRVRLTDYIDFDFTASSKEKYINEIQRRAFEEHDHKIPPRGYLEPLFNNLLEQGVFETIKVNGKKMYKRRK